jgi:hypothetical protein
MKRHAALCPAAFVFLLAIVLGLCGLAARAATIQFELYGKAGVGLRTGNVPDTATGTGAGGEVNAGITLDDVTRVLSINVAWGSVQGFANLTGAVTGANLNGTASSGVSSFVENGGLVAVVPRGSNSASSGSINTTITLSAAQVTDLLAGRYYLEILTTANPGGEIRGNLVPPVSVLETVDFSNAAGGATTVLGLGITTFYGTLATPNDGQDNWQVTIPTGLRLKGVSRTFVDGGGVQGVICSFNFQDSVNLDPRLSAGFPCPPGHTRRGPVRGFLWEMPGR